MTADVSRIAGELQAPVAAVCRALQIRRSTVYARRRCHPTRRTAMAAALDVQVRAIHAESRGRYGCPRVHQELIRQGHRVGRKRVETRMRALGLVGRRPRRFRRTTEANASHCPAPNRLERRFQWAAPNRAWVGDITYVWTLAGQAYLACWSTCARGASWAGRCRLAATRSWPCER